MENITNRIKSFLASNASQWVPAPLIVSLAQKHGYPYDDIQNALKEIAHTPPYACISISDDHHKNDMPRGVYYRKWSIPVEELKQIQQGLAYFDSLP